MGDLLGYLISGAQGEGTGMDRAVGKAVVQSQGLGQPSGRSETS